MDEIIAWMQWLCAYGGTLIAVMGAGKAVVLHNRGEHVPASHFLVPALGGAVIVAAPHVVKWVYSMDSDAKPNPAPDDHQEPMDLPWDTLLSVVGAVLGIIAVVAAVAVATKVVKRGRKRKRAELTRRRAVEARHDAVLEAYGTYESDLLAVLDRPALADVTVPTTERLIHALTEAADARRADRTTSDGAAAYQRAVTALEIAWKAADEHARRSGIEHLPPAEQKSIAQARKLLASALHDGGTEHERRLAYQRAMRLIDGAISVPRQAVAALEHISRPSLSQNPER
ncbi:hypothetical protein [Streptomyces sp. XH2]|uniref:hypothetical protein n=1 Tax=Streptomyces sp. XH2 TaxID=3412483 RepID=UPI003C7A4452